MIVNQAIPSGRSRRRWSVCFQVRAWISGRKRRAHGQRPTSTSSRARARRGRRAAARSAGGAAPGRAQRGSHQLRSPSSSIVAGTRTIRTSVASMSTATASPRPISLSDRTSATTKLPNTQTMIAAAAVMTLAVDPTGLRRRRCGCRRCGRTPHGSPRAGRPRSPSRGRRRSRTASSAPRARSARPGRRRTR